MSEQRGTVESIFLAAGHGDLPSQVPAAVAHPGRGLEGDRHFDDPDAGDITLIEAEVIERMRADHAVDLGHGESRRQVLVRGVDLATFVGQRFRVGEVECQGDEPCEPCQHLAGMVGTPLVLSGLIHSGLRASILKAGTIRPGDAVEVLETSP
jgi:MOSC domain-containing protein YiiM